jgi:hypothetical protein
MPSGLGTAVGSGAPGSGGVALRLAPCVHPDHAVSTALAQPACSSSASSTMRPSPKSAPSCSRPSRAPSPRPRARGARPPRARPLRHHCAGCGARSRTAPRCAPSCRGSASPSTSGTCPWTLPSEGSLLKSLGLYYVHHMGDCLIFFTFLCHAILFYFAPTILFFSNRTCAIQAVVLLQTL